MAVQHRSSAPCSVMSPANQTMAIGVYRAGFASMAQFFLGLLERHGAAPPPPPPRDPSVSVRQRGGEECG
jgi:hypothetical protein